MGELTPQPAPKLSKRIWGRLGKERTQKAKNHPEVCEKDFVKNIQAFYIRDKPKKQKSIRSMK